MKKLLLHTCCGPCFLGVWDDLSQLDIEVTNYFYNPNIQPKEEFDLRLENLRKVATGKSEEVLTPEYDEEEHLRIIEGQEKLFPERCVNCYRLRLEKTARYARENGYDAFSTTLLISPYQQHEVLKRVGEEIGAKQGIEFYYRDWRPIFRKGQEKAKELGLYRQKYCGCIYSKDEAGRKR